MPYEENARSFLSQLGIDLTEKRLGGTLKIIDFVGFMEAMRPYFQELYQESFVNDLHFNCDDMGIHFQYKETQCTIVDKMCWNDLIFGGGKMNRSSFICNHGCDQFQDFFSAVFPIPFVNTNNLSCV